ncbi:diguanylate cyclase [Asticcacaulis sp. AC460]|uniref:diguanylate cyclase domain-containing protein n=1 Tax=Asticcacaulis sp. AC460 TaxID=1282360 RepID=UPI0003C406B5|nr:diguanylate cyclase [Asticcacaulis sp. AC460]ESQ89591.1 diguanylate cyclase [Asticcacaulis sp. AC460]
MTLHARLLLLSRDDGWLQGLSRDLDRLGTRTLSAETPDAACAALADLGIEAVLVNETCEKAWPGLLDQLRDACRPRRIAAIMMRHDDDYVIPPGWDMVFTKDAHPQQISLSVEHLVRACVAEEEYDLRCQTFNNGAQSLDQLMQNQPALSLLSIGQPDPEFLALSHALRAQGCDIVAALSSYSAFDYLHDRVFDAVLLWGSDQPSEALAIASGMRRNTRLYHTPVLLRLNRVVELDLGDAFLRGVSDIANPSAGIAEISDRLMRLARVHRRHMTIRKTLEAMRGEPQMDKGTGLFGRDLFASHLARLAKGAVDRQRPMSICVLKITETPEILRARQKKMLDRAVPQIGSMIARLVRAEDTGGRLSNDVFALALPATTLNSARNVAERISAVIGCTAFDSGHGRPPFVVEFDVGVAEMRPGEPAADVLMRAAAAAGNRDRQAV